MASTSEWSWISINRETDISVSGGVFSSRPNWSMARSRISNDTYSGQLGESATSLSAYNGGVTETVSVPVINYLSFNANTAWTLAATRWDATGYIKNGSMSYTPHYGTTNIPDAGMKNVAFIFKSSGVFYRWIVTEITSAQLASGTWTDYSSGSVVSVYPNSVDSGTGSFGSSIAGVSFTSNNGTFTGDATAGFADHSLPLFVCASDAQNYNQQYVDWFTQTQTWVYKSSWIES